MKRRAFLGSMLAAAACPLVRDATAATPKAPLLLGSGTAGLGAYLGAGCTGTGRLSAYESWLRRDVDQMIEFVSWEALRETRTWSMKCWSKAEQQTVVYSLPMLPSGTDYRLADGAAGKFDDHFKRFGTALAERGYVGTIIRIGW